MKKICILFAVVFSVSSALAQQFRWEPLFKPAFACSQGESRIGISASIGLNIPYNDYSDNQDALAQGSHFNLGILAQTGVLRFDAHYWSSERIRQYSDELPGSLFSAYRGGEVLISLQPIQYFYAGVGGGFVDSDLAGTSSNVTPAGWLPYLTAQAGIEIPFGDWLSLSLAWQTRFELTGKQFDHYVHPPGGFAEYDKVDWLHTPTVGLVIYFQTY